MQKARDCIVFSPPAVLHTNKHANTHTQSSGKTLSVVWPHSGATGVLFGDFNRDEENQALTLSIIGPSVPLSLLMRLKWFKSDSQHRFGAPVQLSLLEMVVRHWTPDKSALNSLSHDKTFILWWQPSSPASVMNGHYGLMNPQWLSSTEFQWEVKRMVFTLLKIYAREY